METKAYFASSVPAALEVAQQELGADALLISSRPTPAHMRQYGRLEVTFAWDPGVRNSGEEPAWQPARRQTTLKSPSERVSEMDEIRQQLSELRAAVTGGAEFSGTQIVSNTAANLQPNLQPREGGRILQQLVDAGLSRGTAVEIASTVARKPGDADATAMRELARCIPVFPYVELEPGESRTLAFIGPPGRGKTTSLVKIAVRLGLARRIPVRIFSIGAHSVGTQGQMARFAEILGTPYQAYESLASFNLALNGDVWKGLALIDTPGISPADRSETSEMASFFAARPEIEKHLVLRADASSADMLRMLSRFSALTPARLLFTGMDEAASPASMIDTLIQSGIPATFVGTGQQIPENLEEVTAERLARAVWAESADADNSRFVRAAA